TWHENCQFGNSLSLMHAIDGGIPCVQFLGRDLVGRRYSAFAGFPSPNQKTAMWLLRSRRSASTTLSFTCERENGPRSPTPAASNAWVYPPLDGESIRSRWAGRGARRRQASSPIRGRSPSRSHSRKLARSRGGRRRVPGLSLSLLPPAPPGLPTALRSARRSSSLRVSALPERARQPGLGACGACLRGTSPTGSLLRDARQDLRPLLADR